MPAPPGENSSAAWDMIVRIIQTAMALSFPAHKVNVYERFPYEEWSLNLFQFLEVAASGDEHQYNRTTDACFEELLGRWLSSSSPAWKKGSIQESTLEENLPETSPLYMSWPKTFQRSWKTVTACPG